MSTEPEKIYLHDPHGYFDDDNDYMGINTVMWSEDRIDEADYEYIRSHKNLAKPDAVSGEVRKHGGGFCEKKIHDDRRGGYLHDKYDDAMYLVDGVAYCGRCHNYIEPVI